MAATEEERLDGAIAAAKKRAIEEYHPTVGDIEPYIPEDLKGAFWNRYLDKYFDEAVAVLGKGGKS